MWLSCSNADAVVIVADVGLMGAVVVVLVVVDAGSAIC